MSLRLARQPASGRDQVVFETDRSLSFKTSKSQRRSLLNLLQRANNRLLAQANTADPKLPCDHSLLASRNSPDQTLIQHIQDSQRLPKMLHWTLVNPLFDRLLYRYRISPGCLIPVLSRSFPFTSSLDYTLYHAGSQPLLVKISVYVQWPPCM